MIPIQYDHGQHCSVQSALASFGQFGQGESVEVVAPVITPTKDHWPRLLHMHGKVISGLQLVRINVVWVICTYFHVFCQAFYMDRNIKNPHQK